MTLGGWEKYKNLHFVIQFEGRRNLREPGNSRGLSVCHYFMCIWGFLGNGTRACAAIPINLEYPIQKSHYFKGRNIKFKIGVFNAESTDSFRRDEFHVQ